jgi:hypothetical protein
MRLYIRQQLQLFLLFAAATAFAVPYISSGRLFSVYCFYVPACFYFMLSIPSLCGMLPVSLWRSFKNPIAQA